MEVFWMMVGAFSCVPALSSCVSPFPFLVHDLFPFLALVPGLYPWNVYTLVLFCPSLCLSLFPAHDPCHGLFHDPYLSHDVVDEETVKLKFFYPKKKFFF